MNNNNQVIIDNLKKILKTKDLGEFLTDEFNRCINILSDNDTKEEEKYFIRIIAEDLISKTRDFPELSNSVNRRR